MKKRKMKLGITVLLLATLLINSQNCMAAQKQSWTLQYLSYAPSSVNISHWTKNVKATGSSLNVAATKNVGRMSALVQINGKNLGRFWDAGITLSKKVTKGKLYKVSISPSAYISGETYIMNGTVKY